MTNAHNFRTPKALFDTMTDDPERNPSTRAFWRELERWVAQDIAKSKERRRRILARRKR